ncbi:alpha/beta fold hydrolase [Natronobacterium texcoconense]|uniref:Pimeloyl-ACP methyl ester carboxylesterase n=1 Tax=Natronobacterium texcoconense TaxID=1095778 RepID=A0A1H1HMA5_NATTX|nr:alpha/beta hydrolase [Natronobacterium texcoconense]SDR26503.1 Pimeloyl-ACP methyl ester carboxylesterase [Natronobacterium texcoconense]
MATDEQLPRGESLSPDDWPTAAERRYADLQEALADEHGLEVESRVVQTDAAGRVHYLEAGDPDGDPVLLLHGSSTTGATWLPMIPALADDYRVILPDRPGRGLSATPSYRDRHLRSFLATYLVELLDELNVDRPHVVGNSLGGLQAFFLELDHDRVDRLCLVGGPGGLTRDFPVVWRLLTVRGVNRLLLWLMGRGDPIESAKSRIEQFIVKDDSAISETYYELIAANGEIPGNEKSQRSYSTMAGSFGRMDPIFDIREEVVTIDRPTCFVWGTADALFDPEVGQPVAKRMPEASFHVLEGCGHVPFLEPGDETATIVREFLDGD